MDLLAKASSWLEKTRAKHASQEVVYVRADSSTTLRATIGRSEFEMDEGNGLVTRVESRDYLILVDDLVLDDQPAEPQPGDRIVEGDLSDGVVYEVMAPVGQHCWRYSDPYRQTYRVHTKYVG